MLRVHGIRKSCRALSLKVKHVAHNNEDAGSTPARPIDIYIVCMYIMHYSIVCNIVKSVLLSLYIVLYCLSSDTVKQYNT